MNTDYLLAFGIVLGVYLVVLFVMGFVKYRRNKKKFDKEKKENESDVDLEK